MSPFRLILRELCHRKLNAALVALVITTAVTVFVAFLTTAEAAHRETTRIVRDLGFNLRIIPKDTDMDQFWATGFADQTMPEETLERLANYPNVFFAYNHLVATLQQKTVLRGQAILLTGLSPAVTAPAQRKQPMGYQIQPGTVIVGFQVAQQLGLKKSGRLELGGEPFTVARCLAESGTEDDIRVFGLLSDVQRVLQMPGRINEIQAIDCLCLTADQEPLKILRRELERALPEAKVIQLRTLADARARQRQTTEKYFAFLMPVLLLTSSLSVGLLAVLNVRERKVEIGILRALGHGSARICALVLGKAALLGLVGAMAGGGLGTALALAYGPGIFQVTAAAIRPELAPLIGALVLAPALATLASLIPALLAIAQDPAAALREA